MGLFSLIKSTNSLAEIQKTIPANTIKLLRFKNGRLANYRFKRSEKFTFKTPYGNISLEIMGCQGM